MCQKIFRIVLPTSLALFLSFGFSAAASTGRQASEAGASLAADQTPVTPAPPVAGQAAIAFGAFAQAQERNHCSVSYTQCSTGTILCQGHSVCTSGSGWVECDGQRTYCPPCQAFCYWTSEIACTGQTSCQSGWYVATCDGVSYECPYCGSPRPADCTDW